MPDHLSPDPASAPVQDGILLRDVNARLREHRGACRLCGFTVTIPRGHIDAPCPRCGGNGKAERTREALAPHENEPARPSLFEHPVNRLPYSWILWISLRNFYRYAARRSLDAFSLALAIATMVIPGRFGVWENFQRTLAASPGLSGLFLGGSVAWIGFVILMLLAWASRGQWGEVPVEPRAADVPGSPLRRAARRIARVHLGTSLSHRWPTFRTVPYLIGLLAAAAVLGLTQSDPAPLWLVAALGTLDLPLVVLAAFFLMGRAAFDRVPPDEYASMVLGGRRAEHMFRWIGWEMYDLCSTFLDANSGELQETLSALSAGAAAVRRELRNPQTPMLSNRDILDRLRKSLGNRPTARLRRDIDRLERKLLGLRMSIRRCAAMKTLAATEFGIHHRRLCDHVFRFSPTIFERRVQKYIFNWRAIARSLEANRSPARPGTVETEPAVSGWRVIDLIQENERIVSRIGRRSNYLRLIVGSTDIFEDVRVFASTTSLRDSLTAYANALTRIAESPTGKGRTSLDRARLTSLYWMQQAHPGIDLHHALTRLCEGGAPWCRERKAELAIRVDFLRSHADPGLRADTPRVEKKCAEFEAHARLWERCTSVLKTIERDAGHSSPRDIDLELLRGLATLVATATHNTQWEINRMMEAELLRWMRDRSDVLIMTYGNSRVVRDVLKCVAMPLMEKREGETNRDTIFIARTEADEFESRMMAFSLREDSRWYHPGKTAELGYGDDELLLSLLEDLRHSDLSVMILLGAESFDPAGRIVQIASAYRQIRRLKESLSELNRHDPERVLFVAVAESYKRSDDLTRDTGFYRDHLDQVALYPQGIIDLIISNYERIDTRRPTKVYLGSATIPDPGAPPK